MVVKERVEALLKIMKERELDAYIIPSSDPHISEYVAEHWKTRAWISGFTGSAGTVVITEKESGLWTDGRYFIQAEQELSDSGIKLFKMGQPGVPSFINWIKDNLNEGEVVGFDGTVMSQTTALGIEKELNKKGIKIDSQYDLVGEIWEDRPSIPMTEVFNHELRYAGRSTKEKLENVRAQMEKKSVDTFICGSLDDIAWLCNVRANDVHCNPVTISYVAVEKNSAYLFIESNKVPENVVNTLRENGIEIKPYDDVFEYASSLPMGNRVFVDPRKTNRRLYDSIPKICEIEEGTNITTVLKAVKNEVEIESLKKCNIKDGTAVVKFLYWLDKNIGKIDIDEVTVAEKLESFRAEQEDFKGPSFDTIAGYKEHAAMCHYKASKESAYKLEPRSMILIDSGGQYLDGTTDITRTIVLGEITEEEKNDFTLVLRGHINLAMTKFMYGTTGHALDVLARQALWNKCLDFNHGTGHGVGFFLNVHEGPQNIGSVYNSVALEEGMLMTNEPGIYVEGKHGIRLENDILVQRHCVNNFGKFMRFDALTLAPFDLRGINVDMLTYEEKSYLNEYHKNVFEKISSNLTEEEKEWLKEATREI